MSLKKEDLQEIRKGRRNRHSQSPILSRSVQKIEIHKNILIVGEGVNTEPSYFEQFREPGVRVVSIGLGESTRKLVQDVEERRKIEEKKLRKKFDETWVVFDKDSFKDFKQAISEAKDKGYQVAYSNQSIEYWFILHFKDHQGGCMERTEYANELNSELSKICSDKPLEYNKDSKKISKELFDVMYKKLQDAYDRAEKIYETKCNNGDPTEESVTTIYQLIHSIKGIISTSKQREEHNKLVSMTKAGLTNKLVNPLNDNISQGE